MTSARPGSRRLTLPRLLALLAAMVITAFVFSLRDQAERVAAYGYPGIFLLSLLANATIILPAPASAVTFAMGAVFHPLGVTLAAATGAALGELTGYLAGFSGQAVIEDTAAYQRLLNWTRRFGGLAVFVLAAIPNPFFDMAGIAAGAMRMPVWLFLACAWLGKLVNTGLFAFGGAASIGWLEGLMR